MAYTPINWQTGDTITAEKMNKMDNGWSYSTSGGGTVICNESVTTEDDGYGSYAGELSVGIAVDAITVTYDNAVYNCTKFEDHFGANDGDWSEYPFTIYDDGYVVTETAGTHTFIITEAGTAVIETSSEFQAVVSSVVDTSMMPMLCVSGVTLRGDVYNASSKGRLLYFKPYGNVDISTCIITDISNDTVQFIPADPNVTATFNNDVFTVAIAG